MSGAQVAPAPFRSGGSVTGMPDLLAQRREEARRLKESAAARRTAAAATPANPTGPERSSPAAPMSPAAADPRSLRRVHSAVPTRHAPCAPTAQPLRTAEGSTLPRSATFTSRPGGQTSFATTDLRRSAGLRGFAPSAGTNPPRTPADLEKLREQARALRGLPPAASKPASPAPSACAGSCKPDSAAPASAGSPSTLSGATPSSNPSMRARVSSALSGIADRMVRRAQLRAAASSLSNSKQAPAAPHSAPRSAPSTPVTQRQLFSTSSAKASPVSAGKSPASGPASRLKEDLGVKVTDSARIQYLGKVERVGTRSPSPTSSFSSPSSSRPMRMQQTTGCASTPPSTGRVSPPNMSKLQPEMKTPPATPMRSTPVTTPGRPPSPAMEQPSKMSRVRSFDSSKASGSPAAFSRVNSTSGSIPSPRTPESRVPPRSGRVPSPEATPKGSSAPTKAFAPWEAGDSVHAIRNASKKLTKENFIQYVYSRHPLKDPSKTLNTQLPIKKQMQKALSHYHPDKQNLAEDGPEWCLICEEICKEITRMYKKRETPAK